jgi:hypothetical protein
LVGAVGKILTMTNVKKWHVIVVDRCCMYKRNVESLWNIFFSIVRLPMPYGIVSLVDLGCVGLCLNE